MRVIALKEHYATQRFLDGPWTQIQGWARVGGSALSGRRGSSARAVGRYRRWPRLRDGRSRRGRCVAHRDGPARLDGEARPRGGDEQFERRFARGGRPDAPIAEIAL